MTSTVETGKGATGNGLFAGLRDYLNAPTAASARQARIQQAYQGWRRFRRNWTAMVGLAIICLLVFVALAAPLLAPYTPFEQDLTRTLQPPSADHWMGTDELGRDIASRMIYGSRITLYIVMLVAVIAAPIGLIIGTVAGYVGGWIDIILMRTVDVFLSFPGLILALAFVAALGPSISNAIIAIALTVWPPIARLARAETLTIRRSDYIAAARIQGTSRSRIIVRHIMPMCLPSVIVRITLNMAGIILTAAGLGFLGLGAQPPSPEWGAMLSTGRDYMLTSWWLAAMPGLAIMAVSLAFNLFGDGLRDVLDPRHD